MRKRSRSWRSIEIDDRQYRWRYGRGTIEVRHERRVVLRVASYVLRGNSSNIFARGQHKRTRDGVVTPAMVRTAIMKLLGSPDIGRPLS